MSAVRKKNSSFDISRLARFAWFRFFMGLSVFVIALSFLTPYPRELIKTIKGEPQETTAKKDIPSPPAPDETETDSDATEPDLRKDREDDDDVLPPPPDAVPPQPPVIAPEAPTTEGADMNHFTPFRLPLQLSTPTMVMPPLPPIIPDGPSSDAIWDINELARGLNLKTEVNFKRSADSATRLRNDKGNYRVSLRMDITLPEPLKTTADFAKVNPHLPRIFPNLGSLTDKAKVSGFYHQLMARKQLEIRKDLVTLNRLLTRHNYYDCESILEITAPGTNRKALWIQADMDVVSDGTDGDRLPHMPAEIVNSSNYQPFTSYRWPKQTDKPNPVLVSWQKRLKDAKSRTATAAQKSAIPTLERSITDLKNNSFLIAEYDPFIVIPLGIMNNSSSAFSPSPGDYAVVICKNKLFPAIVGDAGPRYKIGEASLRLAKEINSLASPYRRPVSDLSVSYIVFPKSADPVKQAPDYAVWKSKCEELLNDLGGIGVGYQLHEWEDLLAPPAPPTPPTPTPGVTPVRPVIDPLTGKKVLPADASGTKPTPGAQRGTPGSALPPSSPEKITPGKTLPTSRSRTTPAPPPATPAGRASRTETKR